MALTSAQIASLLFKQSVGKSSTNTNREFFEEPRDGRQIVFPTQVWQEAGDIPSTAPTLAHLGESGVVRYYEDLSLTAVAGVPNSFFADELVDAIPFNFGDGSYNYTLKSNTDVAIAFGQGDWIVDPNVGVLTFYGTVPANMPPKITFYKYIGDKGVGGGSIASGGSGVENYLDSESANFEVSGTPSVGDWVASEPAEVTITSSASSPLAGSASGVFTHVGPDATAERIKVDSQTIDLDRRGKPIVIRMSVDATDANYVSEDAEIQLWDITGTPAQIYVSGEPKIKKAKGEIILVGFPDVTCSQVQLRIAIPTDNAVGVSWAMKIDRISLGPDKAYPSVYRRSEVIDCTGSGDFTGGSIRVSRVGSLVDISIITSLTFSSASQPASAVGLLPAWARPEATRNNVGAFSATALRVFDARADGQVRFEFRNFSGSLTNATSSGTGPGISYTVEDTESPLLSTTEALYKSGSVRGLAAAQSVDTVTDTTIIFNTNEQQDGGAISLNTSTGVFTVNSRCNITAAGYVSYPSSGGLTAGKFARARLIFNGDVLSNASIEAVPSVSFDNIPIAATFLAEPGDTFSVTTLHNEGSTINTSSARLSVTASPDLSVYGVYGKHEILSATSAAFALNTAGYTANEWMELTGNSVTLPVGIWELTGGWLSAGAGSNNGFAAWWCTNNGNNTTTNPTIISTISGRATVQSNVTATAWWQPASLAVIQVLTPTTIYLNARIGSLGSTAGNVTTTITAKRLV